MYRVLVADDEVTVCKGLRKLIPWDRYGFTVDGFAHNGRQAIETAIASRFDLVITDIRMPVVDGLAVLRRLREAKAPSRAIILSAYRDFEYARVAMENGARAYLLKPIDESLLVGALEEIRGELDAMGPEERARCWETAPPVGAEAPAGDDSAAPPLVLHKHSSTHVIETVIEYMHGHYHRDLTLSLIAKMIGMNPVYLGRVFKATTEISFNDYLNRIRIEKAASLLSDHQNLVYEICDSVGYKDINYFYRMFKSMMGVTPTEYKRRHFG